MYNYLEFGAYDFEYKYSPRISFKICSYVIPYSTIICTAITRLDFRHSTQYLTYLTKYIHQFEYTFINSYGD